MTTGQNAPKEGPIVASVDLTGYRGKIRTEHARIIADGMAEVLALSPDARTAYAVEGLSGKRFRWDVFWAANARNRAAFGDAMDDIYRYADDSHIDTLLRYVVAA